MKYKLLGLVCVLSTLLLSACGVEKNSKEYAVGDVTTMGIYEQDNDTSNGAEPIEWIILDIKDGQALLLSKYVLCSEQYDYSKEPRGWSGSTIYQWLNNDFFNSAFNDEEREKIVLSKDGEDTIGSVFFLSFDEAVKYFGMTAITEENYITKTSYECYYSQDALAKPTNYALEDYIEEVEMSQEEYDKLTDKGIIYEKSVIGNTYVSWWLRTNADNVASCAHVIKQDGSLYDLQSVSNFVISSDIGVRPAVWINTGNLSKKVVEDISGESEKTVVGNAEKNIKSANGICSFYGYDLPLVFQLAHTDGENDNYVFDISDVEKYYSVKGSLICPECVTTSELDGLGIGEHFTTGSGRGYVVSGRESYNNDQREKVILSGDDGQTYEIVNIPAFMIDSYMGTSYYVIISEDGTNYQTVFENIEVHFDNNTLFTDGKSVGDSFDDAVKNGNFENITWNIAYDIHFAEDGTIDILTPADIGSNGVWGGSDTEIWKINFEKDM